MVDKDHSGFQQVLVTSVIVIISTSLVIYTMTTEERPTGAGCIEVLITFLITILITIL
jgi:hypothetical protein